MELVQPLIECAPYNADCARQLQESVRFLSEDDISTLLHEHLDVSKTTHTDIEKWL